MQLSSAVNFNLIKRTRELLQSRAALNLDDKVARRKAENVIAAGARPTMSVSPPSDFVRRAMTAEIAARVVGGCQADAQPGRDQRSEAVPAIRQSSTPACGAWVTSDNQGARQQ
jgi:hypothetical protein